MIPLAEAVVLVAPYYNMFFVAIAIYLFIKLFSYEKPKTFLRPWKLFFIAVLIYVVEQFLVILTIMEVVPVPRVYNAVFEFAIITLFIYPLLVQKQHLQGRRVRAP